MKLLYLVHRLPYPPNKGDKISSFNMLKHFSKRHEVHLGTFVDHPDDWQHVDTVRGYCRDLCVQRLDPRAAKLRSLTGLLTGEALSNVYYRNDKLQAWVDGVLERVRPDAVLMFSGCMGQFVRGKLPAGVRAVFDAEDVDSEKWAGYASGKPWPLSWLYGRESRELRRYEREMAQSFDASVFVSREEAEVFKSVCPEAADKITFRTQGVDVGYFDPAHQLPDPYGPNDRVLVFCGAMDYWPNVAAVAWFTKEVFPRVRAARPDAKFYIVGLAPTDEVKKLGQLPGVVVTGGVPDVRPYVKHAWAVCLPLTIARGIQNKALEGMAMGKRVLGTPAAITGIIPCAEYQPTLATTADEWLACALETLAAERAFEPAAREFIKANYGWEANLTRFEETVFGKRAA
jgi:sugar transferase (PEP-CTERM/EpsH1 system associated)